MMVFRVGQSIWLVNGIFRFAFLNLCLFVSLILTSCNPTFLRETPDKYRGSQTQEVMKFDAADKSCAGFPALRIESQDGTCVGMVSTSASNAFQPRTLLEIPGKPGWFLVTDFAGWSTTSGKIWILKTIGNFGSVTLEPFLSGLSLPHQILMGPGNRVYFSEDTQISSFPVSLAVQGAAIARSQTKTILAGLPPMVRAGVRNSLHPLKNFVFDAGQNLYVNIGAFTDHCADFAGKKCEESDKMVGGGQSADERNHGAVIRRYDFKGDVAQGWNTQFRLVAKGLRNSMGLWFNAKGDLIQVENSRDFPESFRPFEEINVIPAQVIAGSLPAKHYGWPYCYNHNETSDEWKNFSFKCNTTENANYAPPLALLPPHGAPLGLLKYTGSLISGLSGKLMIPLHGYRSPGHRILAVDLASGSDVPQVFASGVYLEDDQSGGTKALTRSYPPGFNSLNAKELISGWYDAPGVRPKGAPVGVIQGTDGALWLADDKNHSILRISKPGLGYQKKPAPARANFSLAYSQLIFESPSWKKFYFKLVNEVLKSSSCAGCHDAYRNAGDAGSDGLAELRYLTGMGNWIVPLEPGKSALFTKLSPAGSSPMPPQDKAFPSLAVATAALATVKAFVNEMPSNTQVWRVKAGKTPDLLSTKRGNSSARVCGKLVSGYHVWVLSTSTMNVGGIAVHEVQVGGQSQIAELAKCPGDNAFYIAASDIEALIK
jgi:glucose/arabinose dehydrogenase